MTDTTTITPEERARLREQADKSYLLPLDEDEVPSVGFDGLTDDRIAYIAAACNSVPRLLDALDAVEAQLADAKKSVPIADNGKIAADKWKSLPRRPDYNDVDCAGCPERRRWYLTWTTEPPNVEHVGKWFWSKIPGQSMAVPVIVAELDGVLGIGRGTSEQGLTMQTCREFGVKFAGPIPTPLEPGES